MFLHLYLYYVYIIIQHKPTKCTFSKLRVHLQEDGLYINLCYSVFSMHQYKQSCR